MGAKSEETQVKSGKVCFIFQNKKQCLVAILIIALGLVIVVAVCVGGVVSIKLVKSSQTSPLRRLSRRDKVGVTRVSQNDVTSLKLFPISISICKSATTRGTAWSDATGCITIYSGGTGLPEYNNYMVSQANADTTNYVDIMSAEGRAKLTQATMLTIKDAHSYSIGIISWYRPIKFTAKILLNDGSSLYSHPGAMDGEDSRRDPRSQSGSDGGYVLSQTSLTVGPAEEASVYIPNGGSFFYFQDPLVIQPQDVATKKKLTVTLAFNPEAILSGNGDTRSLNGMLGSGTLVDAQGHSMKTGLLNLIPIHHYEGQTVTKEMYTINLSNVTVPNSQQTYKSTVEIDIYYVTEDTERAIRAVDLVFIPSANSTVINTSPFNRVFSLSTRNGKVTFLDWRKIPIISDFERLTTTGSLGQLNATYPALFGDENTPVPASFGSMFMEYRYDGSVVL